MTVSHTCTHLYMLAYSLGGRCREVYLLLFAGAVRTWSMATPSAAVPTGEFQVVPAESPPCVHCGIASRSLCAQDTVSFHILS